MSEQPVTLGRTYGLGRKDFRPREHCRRCHEIVLKADQVIMNYILANGRQVEIINRLLKNPDAAAEIITLGQLLAEKDALIQHLTQLVTQDDGEALRIALDTYNEEVNGDGNEDTDGSTEGTAQGDGEEAQGTQGESASGS